jgi:small subunit ribosomal protein S14
MREKQWILLDNFKRKIYLKYEIKNLILKSIINNNYTKLIYKYYSSYNKSKITTTALISKQTNRCFKTGRKWGISKKTRYSRFVFRTESYNGNLPGYRRASW